MGKTYKVAVLGSSGSGKTSLLESLLYGSVPPKLYATIEDTYDAFVHYDRSSREKIRLYDTSGELAVKNPESLRHLTGALDGVVLVYDVTDSESFLRAQYIKTAIDKLGLLHDKKESAILVLGNKLDLVSNLTPPPSTRTSVPHITTRHSIAEYPVSPRSVSQQMTADDAMLKSSGSSLQFRAVDSSAVQRWILKELPKDRSRFVELTVHDRVVLTDAFCWMVTKLMLVQQGKFKFKP